MRLRKPSFAFFFCAALAVYYGPRGSAVAADPDAGSIASILNAASAPANNAPAPAPATPVAPTAGHPAPLTASQVSVSDAGTVEIHVNNADLLEVLRMLSAQSQKNI